MTATTNPGCSGFAPAEPFALRRFQVFGFLWCAAILVHQLYQGRLLVLDATAPLTFAALFALFRPGAPGRLFLLAAVQLFTVAWELPRVVNHWMLMGVTCLGLLIALAPALRAERRGEDPTPFCDEALGPVRAQIIIVYVYATFHKLNAGFFDPALSCGAEHYRRLASAIPLLPDAAWTHWAAIFATLAIEATLPLLLAMRATRWAALALGWGFHLMLGWNGYWDFSSVGSAYYAAFLPAGVLAGFDAARARHRWLARAWAAAASLGRLPWLLPLLAGLLAAALGVTWALGAGRPELVLAVNRAGRPLWLVLWLTLGTLLGLALLQGRAARAADPPGPCWWRKPALLIAPVLVALNGLSPYLGLKSEHSYAMFSNLRTEGDEWNHYLVPRSVRVFGYADEVIRIVESSDPRLDRLGKSGFGLVPFELRRWAQANPQMAVAYERDGRIVRSKPAANDPFLMAPLNPLAAKLILFRPVPPPGRNACLH